MLRGALPTITFLSHIRKVAFRVWTFTWTESGHDSLRPPNQRHHRAKRVRARRQTQAKSIGRLFMLITMVPNMQLFLPIRCGCFSVYRQLKNASWMPNFGFTIGVYVNIKQVSSLRTTDMTYICTGVWQSWVIIQRLNVALAWTVSSFYLPLWDQTWAKTTHYYHVKCPWELGHHPVQPVGSVVLPMPRCLSWPCWLSSRSWTEKRWCCSQMPSKKHRKHKQHTRIPPHEPVCRLTIVLFENGGDLCSEMTSTQKYKT